ncbi:hypothetical protein HY643_04115 [Candidatus Woesearchaeota archaeon]|nr:hypothetical protein [Candidatus Woesearchaeota archaeon]
MPQKDYITKTLKVEASLTLHLADLYRMLHKWFTDRGYEIIEKRHSEVVDAAGMKHTNYFWEMDKKVDPYVKNMINLDCKAITEDVNVEKGVAQNGKITIELQGYLKKDVEDDWAIVERKASHKFLREVYDKYFGRSKLAGFEKDLLEEIRNVMNDIKVFLKLNRFD